MSVCYNIIKLHEMYLKRVQLQYDISRMNYEITKDLFICLINFAVKFFPYMKILSMKNVCKFFLENVFYSSNLKIIIQVIYNYDIKKICFSPLKSMYQNVIKN